MSIYLLILVCVIVIIFFIVNKRRAEANTYKRLHPLFLNSISYVDYVKTTKTRNPVMYFELRQLYKYKTDGEVTANDYAKIIEKYKIFKKLN